MNKSPAFQFYPDDFMGGKPGLMEPEETHIYVWLLCLDWNQDGFVEDERALAKWCRISLPRFRKAWAAVRGCFVEHDGRLYNPRLEKERAKQQEWREKSSKGGKKSGEARAKGGSTTVGRVVDECLQPNTNIPFPSPTPKQKRTTTAAVASGRKARPSGTDPRHASWLEAPRAAYEAQYGVGSFPFGEAGKHLKALRDAGHSPEKIAEHLTRYLAKTDAQFSSIARFAKTFGDYGALVLQGPEVVDHWMSPEVERLSRATGYVA